jgi:hypothetical protein
MEKWLKKNLKYVTIILLILFISKGIQSCNRKMSLRIQEKNLTIEKDSLINIKDNIIMSKDLIIDSLKEESITKDFINKDLINELKIAGVRVDEAQRRADAVQRTAERVKTNTTTTIEIKGAEEVKKDTNKIINEDETQ